MPESSTEVGRESRCSTSHVPVGSKTESQSESQTGLPPDDPIYTEDRSGAELDDRCGMAYYWNRIFGGRGIVPKDEPEALQVGREIHEDFAAIGELPDSQLTRSALECTIEGFLAKLSADDMAFTKHMERLYRRLGWYIAWATYIEPALRRDWENVSIESDIILDRTPLWVSTTPDRILRNRMNKEVLQYVELKSTISASQKWLDSWRYAIQLHIGIKAASEELGEEIKYAKIYGLMKGQRSAVDDRLVHPYVWAYFNTASGKWSHEYERGANWVPRPVWEFPGGIVSWVIDICGEWTAKSQFPTTAPVFLNEKMLNEWTDRRLSRQKQIADWQTNPRTVWKLTEIFPKKQSFCRPAFGDACPYVAACWNAQTNYDPLQHGDYVQRQPHHTIELIGVE
jgi:hypothetical protein